MRKTTEQRFWEKVDKSGDCWLWTAGKNHAGYGSFYVFPKIIELAHRLSWIMAYGGPIHQSTFICHRCDNPACVRPDHLFKGTQLDNMRDMGRKGRGRRILTPEQIREIKRRCEAGENQRVLAREFGVTHKAISHHNKSNVHELDGLRY